MESRAGNQSHIGKTPQETVFEESDSARGILRESDQGAIYVTKGVRVETRDML